MWKGFWNFRCGKGFWNFWCWKGFWNLWCGKGSEIYDVERDSEISDVVKGSEISILMWKMVLKFLMWTRIPKFHMNLDSLLNLPWPLINCVLCPSLSLLLLHFRKNWNLCSWRLESYPKLDFSHTEMVIAPYFRWVTLKSEPTTLWAWFLLT